MIAYLVGGPRDGKLWAARDNTATIEFAAPPMDRQGAVANWSPTPEELWEAPRIDTHLYKRADVVVFEYVGKR